MTKFLQNGCSEFHPGCSGDVKAHYNHLIWRSQQKMPGFFLHVIKTQKKSLNQSRDHNCITVLDFKFAEALCNRVYFRFLENCFYQSRYKNLLKQTIL